MRGSGPPSDFGVTDGGVGAFWLVAKWVDGKVCEDRRALLPRAAGLTGSGKWAMGISGEDSSEIYRGNGPTEWLGSSLCGICIAA
jgi:hypothetical protein